MKGEPFTALGLSRKHVLALVAVRIDGKTHQQAADEMKLSRVRITQLVNQAIDKLAKYGLSLPAVRPNGRVLSCGNDYLDNLLRNSNGTYHSGQGDNDYQPWN